MLAASPEVAGGSTCEPTSLPTQGDGASLRLKSFNQTTCCICLEKYTPENPPIEYFCKHAFHLQCSESWFLRSPRCPVCDRIIRGQPSHLVETQQLSRVASDSTVSLFGNEAAAAAVRHVDEQLGADRDHVESHALLSPSSSSSCSHSMPSMPTAGLFDERVPMEVDGVPSSAAGAAPTGGGQRRILLQRRVAKVRQILHWLAMCCCRQHAPARHA